MADRNSNDKRYDDRERLRSLSEKSNKELKSELLRKELGDFSSMEPEQMAKLLRSWLNSDE